MPQAFRKAQKDEPGYFKLIALGVITGFGSSIFSGLNAHAFNTPLGYSPMTFKNGLKAALGTAIILPAIVLINDKFDIVK